MSPLILHHRETEPALSVPLWFIRDYMPEANGDFVKVFLFLQLISLQADAALSVADIADQLSCTESDVVRALRYWDRKGLIVLTMDENGQPAEIAFLSPKAAKAEAPEEAAPAPIAPAPVRPAAKPAAKAARKPQPIAVETGEELEELCKVIEAYLGKTLNSREVQVVAAWYHHTDGNADLIDYLVDYCVTLKDPDRPSFDYMNAVLTAWQEAGITTAAQAKAETRISRKEESDYLSTIGSSRKRLTREERDYLARAKRNYGMPFEQILFAATLTARREAGFPYFMSIVDNWNEKGIRTLAAAEQDAEAHKAEAAAKARQERAAASGTSAPRKTSFHNFEQRASAGGSWDELEVFHPAQETQPETPAEVSKEQEEWQQLLQSFRKDQRKHA